MSWAGKAIAVAVATGALALGVAAPAGAGPTDDPCQLAVTFLCQFVPVAPDLEQSIDLTQEAGMIAGEPVPQMPGTPDIDYGRPSDVCANGCI